MTPGFESITEKVEQDGRPQDRAGERLDNALHKTESLHAQAAPESAPRLISQQGNAREDHRVTLSRAHFKCKHDAARSNIRSAATQWGPS